MTAGLSYQKQMWAAEEEAALKEGVAKHSRGKWTEILEDPKFATTLANCSNISFKATVEEGIVVGGGCTLLRLASTFDAINEPLENDDDKAAKRLLDENCKTLNCGCNL